MKRILVFGDSNSWGYTPITKKRMSHLERWPKVMGSLLGDEFEVIEDCMNGRTTVFDDPLKEYRNGYKQIGVSMLMHNPLDLLIVMLGVNDLRTFYGVHPEFIQKGMDELIKKALQHSNPKVLLVSPVQIKEWALTGPMGFYYDERSIRWAPQLSKYYRELATANGYEFLDAEDFAVVSDDDGVHMDVPNHIKLAHAIYEKIKKVLC